VKSSGGHVWAIKDNWGPHSGRRGGPGATVLMDEGLSTVIESFGKKLMEKRVFPKTYGSLRGDYYLRYTSTKRCVGLGALSGRDGLGGTVLARARLVSSRFPLEGLTSMALLIGYQCQ